MFISIAVSLVVGVSAFAQENEVKSASKALKKDNPYAAKEIIDKIDIEDLNYYKIDAEVVSDYFFVKGNIYKALGEKDNNDQFLVKAAVAYEDLVLFEKGKSFKAKNIESGDYEYFRFKEDLDKAMASGDYKNAKVKDRKKYYTEDITQTVNDLALKFHQGAIDAYNAQEFKKSREYFVNAYQVYQNPVIGKQDTILLYNAAAVGINENNYPAALNIYNKLLEMNYTGISTVYEATNVETGEKQSFATQKDMDVQLKFKVVENDTVYKTANNQPSIYRSVGQIYLSMGDADTINKKDYYSKALKVLEEGKKKFPGDYDMLLTLGNTYLKEGNQQGFINAMQEAIAQDPTNEVLYYNIGVVSNDLGMKAESRVAYEKAIEIKPDYTDAYINLAAMILGREKEINEEISALPIKLNRKTKAKFERLKAEKNDVYKEAIGYLEGAYEYDKTNVGLLQTMKNIYYTLDRNDDFMKIKKELDALGE